MELVVRIEGAEYRYEWGFNRKETFLPEPLPDTRQEETLD